MSSTSEFLSPNEISRIFSHAIDELFNHAISGLHVEEIIERLVDLPDEDRLSLEIFRD